MISEHQIKNLLNIVCHDSHILISVLFKFQFLFRTLISFNLFIKIGYKLRCLMIITKLNIVNTKRLKLSLKIGAHVLLSLICNTGCAFPALIQIGILCNSVTKTTGAHKSSTLIFSHTRSCKYSFNVFISSRVDGFLNFINRCSIDAILAKCLTLT